jgi:hypothetical protein
MSANTKDINDDAKKISFVLSYMKAGTTLKMAESWKNRFVEKYLIPAQPPALPSYPKFLAQLDANFIKTPMSKPRPLQPSTPSNRWSQ